MGIIIITLGIITIVVQVTIMITIMLENIREAIGIMIPIPADTIDIIVAMDLLSDLVLGSNH